MSRPPVMLYAPDNPNLFGNAAIFVALVALGPDTLCRASQSANPSSPEWSTGIVQNENWWTSMRLIVEGESIDVSPSTTLLLGKVFDTAASMTTGDAYDVKPFVLDEELGDLPKLVTTGLIDPNLCFWGERTCRYLKSDYQFPRVGYSEALSNSLKKRIVQSKRPKIIVAGLSGIVEAFLDYRGEYIGAVSTFSIFHHHDDVDALSRVLAELLSDRANHRFRLELGGNAMGGGNITMKRDWLRDFPLGRSFEAE